MFQKWRQTFLELVWRDYSKSRISPQGKIESRSTRISDDVTERLVFIQLNILRSLKRIIQNNTPEKQVWICQMWTNGCFKSSLKEKQVLSLGIDGVSCVSKWVFLGGFKKANLGKLNLGYMLACSYGSENENVEYCWRSLLFLQHIQEDTPNSGLCNSFKFCCFCFLLLCSSVPSKLSENSHIWVVKKEWAHNRNISNRLIQHKVEERSLLGHCHHGNDQFLKMISTLWL